MTTTTSATSADQFINSFNQARHADVGLGNLSLFAQGGNTEFIARFNNFNLAWDAPVEVRVENTR